MSFATSVVGEWKASDDSTTQSCTLSDLKCFLEMLSCSPAQVQTAVSAQWA